MMEFIIYIYIYRYIVSSHEFVNDSKDPGKPENPGKCV